MISILCLISDVFVYSDVLIYFFTLMLNRAFFASQLTREDPYLEVDTIKVVGCLKE